MINKIILLLLILISSSFASFENITIGKIDRYYDDKLSHYELETIIKEIEFTFENQLGMNIFDYSNDGKTIDILYVPPTKLEKRIERKKNKIKTKKQKLQDAVDDFPRKQKELKLDQKELNSQTKRLNKKTNALNIYIRDVNKKSKVSKAEYEEIKSHIASKKYEIDKEVKRLKTQQRTLNRKVSRFNNKVASYNSKIHEFNRLNTELEAMSRSYKKIKGATLGYDEITQKTFYRNGKKIKEESSKNRINKIEIYGFSDLKELKAILAHEIGHLVGVPHIEKKDALMNPILQKNQINELKLTRDDILNFKSNF